MQNRDANTPCPPRLVSTDDIRLGESVVPSSDKTLSTALVPSSGGYNSTTAFSVIK